MGLGNGPSVQGLGDLYGTRWRQAHSEQVMYGRRKVIIDEIRRRQAEGINTGAREMHAGEIYAHEVMPMKYMPLRRIPMRCMR